MSYKIAALFLGILTLVPAVRAEEGMNPSELSYSFDYRNSPDRSGLCSAEVYVQVKWKDQVSGERAYQEKEKPILSVGEGAKALGSGLLLGAVSVATLGLATESMAEKVAEWNAINLDASDCKGDPMGKALRFMRSQKAKLDLARQQGRLVAINNKAEVRILSKSATLVKPQLAVPVPATEATGSEVKKEIETDLHH